MQASRWPWLTLLACAAATGNAGAQVSAPSDAGQIPSTPPPADVEATEREWQLPPLRISGTLSYEGRLTRGGGEPGAVSHLVSATLGTSTYIYQPWFATLNGAIGLTSSWGSSSAGVVGSAFNDAQVHDRIRTTEQFITGNARLDLFPRSRFPAEVHYERLDSRTDTGLDSGIDFRRQNFGFSQRYRPESGAFNVVGSYDHHDQTGLGFRSKQDSLSADFTTRWKANDLALGASFSRAANEGFDDESRFTSLVARHAYTPSSALSLNSTANLTRTEDRGAAASDLQVLQLSSVGLYHPDRSPLTLSGSLRGLVLREDVAGNAVDSFGATVGANYEVNANLRLTANGGANFNRTQGGGDANSYSGTLNASYQGDAREWRNIHYDWFAGASLGGSTASSTSQGNETEKTVGLQLGHTASRAWRLGQDAAFSLNAGQTLSASNTHNSRHDLSASGLGSVRTLLNTVAGTWQNNGDGRTAYARVSYSDSLELGGGHARFQLFNFQLSGNFELGYGRSVTGDLTWQRTMQRTGDFTLAGDSGSNALGLRTRSQGASGEVSFRQNQVFGVPRLRFVSRLRLAQDVLKQPGQLLSIPDRETRLWENRLDWSIGRLETQLVLRFSQIDGRRVDSLWFRVQRTFGN